VEASEAGIQERIRALASNPAACTVAAHIPVDRTVVDHTIAEVASADHIAHTEARTLAVACTVVEAVACMRRYWGREAY